MADILINNKPYSVADNLTIIQACEIAGIEIPRFCYHERLAIAGNCRMCLVEVEGGPPKPIASCAMPVAAGMKIHTDTPMVKKAREGVMEFLLANHPLDCPICDQGGECDLQDQAYQYGKNRSRFIEPKRAVKDKNMGPLVETHMTRCIHCTRCVRFMADVAGTGEIGGVGRGEDMEITTYLENSITSELSGNIIDLCPVGALTSKPHAYQMRSWELRKSESVDVMDAVGSNIRIDSRGMEVMRILPVANDFINEEWISDKTRFCYDGLKYQRLDRCYVRRAGKLESTSFEEALNTIVSKIGECSHSKIAALSGPLSPIEDIYALKALLLKLGSTKFDCRLNSEKIECQDRSSYLFNSTIAGIDSADLILLVGVNPRKDAPIINARIRKRWLARNCTVAVLGSEIDLTYPYTYLGDDPLLLQNLVDGRGDFAKLLANAKNPMIIIGNDVVTRKDGLNLISITKKIAQKYNAIRDDWNGYNFLAKSTGLVNGLDTGFTTTDPLLEEISQGKIEMLFLLGVDDSIDFEQLKNNGFIVYIGSHGDAGAELADVILPAAAYAEKEATYVNLEGRAQMSVQVVAPLGAALEEYKIILKLADKLGYDLGFFDLPSLRSEIAKFNPNLAQLNSITKTNWLIAQDSTDKVDWTEKVITRDFDFYLTNPIARASVTLNKCSKLLAKNNT